MALALTRHDDSGISNDAHTIKKLCHEVDGFSGLRLGNTLISTFLVVRGC